MSGQDQSRGPSTKAGTSTAQSKPDDKTATALTTFFDSLKGSTTPSHGRDSGTDDIPSRFASLVKAKALGDNAISEGFKGTQRQLAAMSEWRKLTPLPTVKDVKESGDQK